MNDPDSTGTKVFSKPNLTSGKGSRPGKQTTLTNESITTASETT